MPQHGWTKLSKEQKEKNGRPKLTKKILAVCAALAFCACASSTASLKEPDWVRDPYTKYDRQANVAAVGNGITREAAEKDSLGKLAGLFGQSIQVEEKVTILYQEAVKSGAAATWSEDASVNTNILTSTGMDSLVGAEIGEVWHDGRSNYYAAAVLNKARAAQAYSSMIRSNRETIENLVIMPEAEKSTLDGFARYQLAAAIADVTNSYANLLSFIGAPAQGLIRGDEYRFEALNIARAIPVGIRVRNDRSGRIEGAFAKALSDLGFRSGENDSRYLLDVNIVTTPVVIAGNQNLFTRIELKANLIDTIPGAVLLPFDFNSREGHITQAEADNRAYAAAERKINEDYPIHLGDYLYNSLPKK